MAGYAGSSYASVPHAGAQVSTAASGTLTVTLPSLTASIAGDPHREAVLAANLPSLAGDIEGTYTLPGTSGILTATLPSLSASMAGTYATTGSLTASLPALTGTILANIEATGTLTATLPSLTANLTGANGNDFLVAVLPRLSASINAHVYPFVKVGTVKTNRGNGIRLSGSAGVEVDAPLEDDPPNLTTTPIHIITPTVPAPTLVNGRPQ